MKWCLSPSIFTLNSKPMFTFSPRILPASSASSIISLSETEP